MPPDEIEKVQKYANKALGCFIVLVSRAGAAQTVEATQFRTYRDDDTAIIVVSDEQLLQMIILQENDEEPEDVLEDLLNRLLSKY